jgi:hypothetical protein
VFADDRTCPHCGASLRSSAGKAAAMLVGLALTGCANEPVYGTDTGVPESGTETTGDDEASDTATGTETDTDGSDTGTDTTSTDSSDSTDTDSGSDSDTVIEPLYGLADSGE